MRHFATTLITVAALTACTETEPSEDLVVVTQGDAVAARAQADSSAANAVQTSSAIVSVIEEPATGDYSEDGTYDATGTGPSCRTAALVDGELVLTFDGCDALDGTVRISAGPGQPTTVTFGDDFTFDGSDIDGSFSMQIRPRAGEYSVHADVTNGTEAHGLDLEVRVADGNVTFWGESAVDRDVDGMPLGVQVLMGSEAAPLELSRDCACPVAGDLGLTADLLLDRVVIDLDAFITPRDGSDDYPLLTVGIAPVPASAGADLLFSDTCVDPTADVYADDFAVAMATADLEVAVDEACAAGEIDAESCATFEVVLPLFPDTLDIDVPASVLAETAEAVLQPQLELVCAL